MTIDKENGICYNDIIKENNLLSANFNEFFQIEDASDGSIDSDDSIALTKEEKHHLVIVKPVGRKFSHQYLRTKFLRSMENARRNCYHRSRARLF